MLWKVYLDLILSLSVIQRTQVHRNAFLEFIKFLHLKVHEIIEQTLNL